MSDRAVLYFYERVADPKATAEDLHYYNKAILALDKQVPKLVIHNRTFWHYSHYCPSCDSYLEKEGLKYCPDCGQKLDWSTYELGLKYVR